MSTFGLKATRREETGKGAARRLRAAGRLPAVMYGVGDPTPLSINLREVTRMLTIEGANHGLIDLDIEGVGKKGVVIRDAQIDPIKGTLMHCDLYEVQKGHKVTVTVGIQLVGDTPIGVHEEQGILQLAMHEVELDCLPNAIPNVIEVDASALKVGDSLHVSDLNVPEGAHLHAAPEATVVSVLAPKLKAEGEGEESAEGAEESAEGAEESAEES